MMELLTNSDLWVGLAALAAFFAWGYIEDRKAKRDAHRAAHEAQVRRERAGLRVQKMEARYGYR